MSSLGQIKNKSVSSVTDLKILGRVGTLFFFKLFFFLEKIQFNFMHFERQFCLSKCIKLFFSRKTEKNSRFHQ